MADSESAQIPSLDCSKIKGNLEEIQDTEAFREFANEFGKALESPGILCLTNHDVDSKLIDAFFEKSLEFFKLPEEVKEKYRKVDPLKNFHGFSHMDDENLNEQELHTTTDFNEIWDSWNTDAFDESKFPTETPGFKKVFDDIRPIMADLTLKLLKALGIVLKLEDTDSLIKKHSHLMDRSVETHETTRSYYYCPLDANDDIHKGEKAVARMAEHSDWGTFTLMIPDKTDGFEGQDRKSGKWFPIVHAKGSIILCPGLMMENLSGGVFHALRHRVVLDKETCHLPRQSYDLYVQPDGHAICTPMVDEHEEWNPKYPKKVHGQTHFDYFNKRVQGSRKVKK